MIIAMTGATGFVGRWTLDAALAAGHQVRALTRRPQPTRDSVTWIAGDLNNPGALCEGANAVLHIAGVVNAPDRAGFAAGNVAGTERIVVDAQAAGVRRFVHVSSLAAREPALSDYGWSKAGAERLVEASGLDWLIIRPPAVYGPGDTEMRELFVLAKHGLALLPPAGRLSVVHVDDLAQMLLACVTAPSSGAIYEVEDASGGLDHRDFAGLIGAAVGRHVRGVALPRAVLRVAAWADRLLRGSGAKLTADRVAYFCHPDWTADPVKAPPPALWRPEIPTAQGLAETAAWYRARGWL